MAKQTRSNLIARAGLVGAETTYGANTATKIGGLHLDTIDSIAFEWEQRPYLDGELAIWQGRIVKAFGPTLAVDSPGSAPNKWIDYVIDSLDELADNGPDYPVLAGALKAYLAQQINKVNQVNGTVIPKATIDLLNEGLDDNAYITSYLLLQFVNKLVDIIQNEGADKKVYDLITALPDLEKASILLQLLSVTDAPGTAKLRERVLALKIGLDEVLKANSRSPESIYLSAQGNYHTEQRVGETRQFRGIDHWDYNAQGIASQLYRAGYTPEGNYAIDYRGKRVLEFSPDGKMVLGGSLLDGRFRIQADTLNYYNAPLSSPDKVSHIQVTEFNSLTNTEDTHLLDMAGLVSLVLQDPRVKAVFGSTGAYTILQDEIECFDQDQSQVPGNAITQFGPKRFAGNVVGIPQSHTLNRAGQDIFWDLRDISGGREETMTISFPDNTHYQINYPLDQNGQPIIISDYSGGSIKLEPIQ